jgi:hypothetical protein
VKKYLTREMVTLLLGGLAAFVAIALFAPVDSREMLFGANGLVMSVVAHWLRNPRERALERTVESLRPPPLDDTATPPERPSAKHRTMPPLPLLLVGTLLSAGAWSLHLTACGASAELRGAYAIEQARCISNERQIIAREGSTREADREAMELERERCDAALRAIEAGE